VLAVLVFACLFGLAMNGKHEVLNTEPKPVIAETQAEAASEQGAEAEETPSERFATDFISILKGYFSIFGVISLTVFAFVFYKMIRIAS
jgi:hypothetical protein